MGRVHLHISIADNSGFVPFSKEHAQMGCILDTLSSSSGTRRESFVAMNRPPACVPEPAYPSAPPPPPESKDGVVQVKDLMQGYQCYLLLDISGSMLRVLSMQPNGSVVTRAHAQRELALAVASAMDLVDPDGIDVCFFNDTLRVYCGVRSSELEDIYANRSSEVAPQGTTDLAAALQWAFDRVLSRQAQQPDYRAIVVVVTDGAPDTGMATADAERDKVARVIVNTTHEMKARNMKDEQLGVQILQVGSDLEATKFLTWLDEGLADTYQPAFDIVDTTRASDVDARGGLMQALVNSLTD